MAVRIQQIPAPTFAEAARGSFIAQQFAEQGLADASVDEVGNVYARILGTGEAAPVIVSAHLDTVFPIDTDLTVKRVGDRIAGPGIGDNSLGVAGLFGLLWALQQQEKRLPGDIWLVANVGEEGLGDLKGMKAVVDRFGETPLAYVVVEGMSLGQIYHRGLGVRRYRITINTAGGHSWVDFGKPSAIHELAEMVVQLNRVPIPVQPRSSLNVGVISGGTSINTIAAQAQLELDLRSEDPKVLLEMCQQVEAIVASANRLDDDPVRVDASVIGQRPAGMIEQSHPLALLASRCLEEQRVAARMNIGSTDANIPLSRGLPAICLGLTLGGKAHTKDEYIFTSPLRQGLAQLICVVEGVFTLR
ncbi:MAG: M20/M25/M40 family metallo-hydrolase [Anaerolineales bacterium]|nr:M20/M25/M40 family metallo-hydrolase [Anaerolineales bacterium]